MVASPERRALFFIFGCSGLAGLIYESIWTHYLKLFLGHAAHAQTLVLAIFMAGIALGSWASSRLSGRWRRLLAAYARSKRSSAWSLWPSTRSSRSSWTGPTGRRCPA